MLWILAVIFPTRNWWMPIPCMNGNEATHFPCPRSRAAPHTPCAWHWMWWHAMVYMSKSQKSTTECTKIRIQKWNVFLKGSSFNNSAYLLSFGLKLGHSLTMNHNQDSNSMPLFPSSQAKRASFGVLFQVNVRDEVCWCLGLAGILQWYPCDNLNQRISRWKRQTSLHPSVLVEHLPYLWLQHNTTWRIRQLQVAAEVSALVLAIDGGSTEVSWPKQLVHRCFPLWPALKFWCPYHVSWELG